MAKLQEMSKFPWEVLLNGRLIKKIILRNLEPEKIYTNLNFFLIENLLYYMFFFAAEWSFEVDVTLYQDETHLKKLKRSLEFFFK